MYRVRGSGWRMSSECIESGESGWRMAGKCIESGESGWRMAGERIESGQFSKMAILASTRIRQNWQKFWRVLEIDKFAGEWPLLRKNLNLYLRILLKH